MRLGFASSERPSRPTWVQTTTIPAQQARPIGKRITKWSPPRDPLTTSSTSTRPYAILLIQTGCYPPMTAAITCIHLPPAIMPWAPPFLFRYSPADHPCSYNTRNLLIQSISWTRCTSERETLRFTIEPNLFKRYPAQPFRSIRRHERARQPSGYGRRHRCRAEQRHAMRYGSRLVGNAVLAQACYPCGNTAHGCEQEVSRSACGIDDSNGEKMSCWIRCVPSGLSF